MSHLKNKNVFFLILLDSKNFQKNNFLNFFLKNLQNFDFNCTDTTPKILQDILHIPHAYFVIQEVSIKIAEENPQMEFLKKHFHGLFCFKTLLVKCEQTVITL